MFGLYALASDDLIDSLQPTITGSAIDPSYPATNWLTVKPAKPVKLTTTSGWFEIDFGTAVNAAVFAPLYHNFDPGLSVVLKWNSSSSWASPAGSVSVTVPAWREDGWPISPWEELVGTPTYQFYRLEVALTGPANSEALSLGRFYLGGALRELERDVRWGVVEDEDQKIIDDVTEGGVELIAEPWGPQRSFTGEFGLTDAQTATLLTVFRAAHRRVKPWLLIPDAAVNDAWIVRFLESRWSRTRETIDHNVLPFRVRELSRGLPWP